MKMNRCAGVLVHPTSLPGPWGIGDIGQTSIDLIEWLANARQKIWQILPLGPTGYGDSPYASSSTFAGNELLISIDGLAQDGLLSASEVGHARTKAAAFPHSRVDFAAVEPLKRALITTACERFLDKKSAPGFEGFAQFALDNASWLDDYAFFRALKDHFTKVDPQRGGACRGGAWHSLFPDHLAQRQNMEELHKSLSHEIELYRVQQYFFSCQWNKVKNAAHDAGVEIMGDIPLYTAEDSVDVWSRQELFLLDSQGKPTEVAGVPPDYFSADGQRWGNPLFRWDAHEKTHFTWWKSRIAAALARYDIIRIDHFRGLESFWAVPAAEDTARNGSWRKAPGKKLFAALGSDLPIVAEDLGFITPEVLDLRDSSGFPGMRILQFAFDAAESGTAFDPDNPFLPHNYPEHCVAYTGTHDNETTAGWWHYASRLERDYFLEYCGCNNKNPVSSFIRELFKSKAAWAIVPMQDHLYLGSEARMNTPSKLGNNWAWRCTKDQLGAELAASVAEVSAMYSRVKPGSAQA